MAVNGPPTAIKDFFLCAIQKLDPNNAHTTTLGGMRDLFRECRTRFCTTRKEDLPMLYQDMKELFRTGHHLLVRADSRWYTNHQPLLQVFAMLGGLSFTLLLIGFFISAQGS